jgi:hypothetical protein
MTAMRTRAGLPSLERSIDELPSAQLGELVFDLNP